MRYAVVAIAVLFAGAAGLEGQLYRSCATDPDVREVLAGFVEMQADSEGWIEVDADGMHVEPHLWSELETERKKVLMIAADAHFNCVVWPAITDEPDPEYRCGMRTMHIYRNDETWDVEPRPIARTLPAKYGGCDFDFDPEPDT